MAFEHCSECDAHTGRAGRHDDSIYFDTQDGKEVGPLCEDCLELYDVDWDVGVGTKKPASHSEGE